MNLIQSGDLTEFLQMILGISLGRFKNDSPRTKPNGLVLDLFNFGALGLGNS